MLNLTDPVDEQQDGWRDGCGRCLATCLIAICLQSSFCIPNNSLLSPVNNIVGDKTVHFLKLLFHLE